MTLIRIDAPHFVAGLLIRDGRVVQAAPILGWMVGKPRDYVEFYCRRKGWHIDDQGEGKENQDADPDAARRQISLHPLFC